MRELDARGHLKDRGQPLERMGKVVRGQQKTVTDGPFTEAKDLIGGYTLVEARNGDSKCFGPSPIPIDCAVARSHFAAAADIARNTAERQYLQDRLRECESR
jgi:hypothetical protein